MLKQEVVEVVEASGVASVGVNWTTKCSPTALDFRLP